MWGLVPPLVTGELDRVTGPHVFLLESQGAGLSEVPLSSGGS